MAMEETEQPDVQDRFGQSCISIDKIIEEPTCRAIVKSLEESSSAAKVEILAAPLVPKREEPVAIAPATPSVAALPPASSPAISVATQDPKQLAAWLEWLVSRTPASQLLVLL